MTLIFIVLAFTFLSGLLLGQASLMHDARRGRNREDMSATRGTE